MLDGLGYQTPMRAAALLASHLVERDCPVLDVGAGTGLAGEALAGHGFTAIDALDFSPEMLAVAISRGVYRAAIEADLNRLLPVSDDSYGALVSTGTFTHSHVDAGCLPELFRILRRGGLFAGTVHRDVWRHCGFEEMTSHLASQSVLETVLREEGTYYRGSVAPEGYYCIWRRVR